MYVPLVIAALSGWKPHRLYLALDTTVLWARYCMIHLSVVCCGRAVPLLWRVLEQANVPPLLLRNINRYCEKPGGCCAAHEDVMLLADRGNACP